MSELELSIIIVSWNTKGLLKDCLDSVRRYTGQIQYEVIVVDNASSDGSVEMLKSDYPLVKLIINERNEGFSKANNKGVHEAVGEFVLLLNSDTLIKENIFFNLVRFMKEMSEVGICSPAILNLNGDIQTMRTWNMTPFQSFKRIINIYKVQHDKRSKVHKRKDIIDAEIVAGVCFMVRRQVFHEVGLLDENYFMYNEEDDFCRRVREKGWKIAYITGSGVYHYRGGSYGDKATKQMVKMKAYESDLYFFKKHYSVITAWLLKSTYKIVITIRLIILLTRYVFTMSRDKNIWLNVRNEWKLFMA